MAFREEIERRSRLLQSREEHGRSHEQHDHHADATLLDGIEVASQKQTQEGQDRQSDDDPLGRLCHPHRVYPDDLAPEQHYQ
jgi:hypothetical protein